MHKLHRLRAGSLQEEGGVAGPPPHRQPPPVVCSILHNHGRGDDSSPLGIVCKGNRMESVIYIVC